MTNIKIELHLLQNFPPSCLNRDDANMPKECDFGGVRRARISSQCLKRTAREYFKNYTDIPTGDRTRYFKRAIREGFSLDSNSEVLDQQIDALIAAFYSQMDTKVTDRTAVLTFVSGSEVQEAINCIKEFGANLLEKKLAEDVKKTITARLASARKPADIALFGRMLAENKDFNVDAACQVAHAISTNAIKPKFDFYTAVDDLNTDDTGAGMMGNLGYNSACFYRYAAIDRDQLASNLKGDTSLADRAIRGFLEASVNAVPNARINSNAQNVRPSLGVFVVRSSGLPLSLVNAFAEPVPDTNDLIGESIKKLNSYFITTSKVHGAFKDADVFVFHESYNDQIIDGGTEEYPALINYDQKSSDKAIESVLNSIKARSA